MIIDHPVLDARAMYTANEKYAKLYNADKEIRERLRPAHIELLNKLIGVHNFQIGNNNKIAKRIGNNVIKAIDTDNIPSLSVKNPYLKTLSKYDERTIRRHTQRLQESGLIEKVWHGRKRNFEIFISPHLFAIEDSENKKNCLKPNPERILEIHKRTNCPLNTESNRNYFNNKIIHQKESAKADSFEIETKNGNNNGNTENCANPAQLSNSDNPLGLNIPENLLKNWKQKKPSGNNDVAARKADNQASTTKKGAKIYVPDPSRTNLQIVKATIDRKIRERELSPAEKIANREKEIKQMRNSYAVLMLETMIQYIIPEFKAWGNYFATNAANIADDYFGQFDTFSSISNAWSGYLERLTAAKRFKDNNPGYTPYPHIFFNKNNLKNGFENPEWKRNKRKWDKQHRNQDDRRKIEKAIRNLNANPTKRTVDKQIEYLKNNTTNDWALKGFFAVAYKSHKKIMNQKNSN